MRGYGLRTEIRAFFERVGVGILIYRASLKLSYLPTTRCLADESHVGVCSKKKKGEREKSIFNL